MHSLNQLPLAALSARRTAPGLLQVRRTSEPSQPAVCDPTLAGTTAPHMAGASTAARVLRRAFAALGLAPHVTDSIHAVQDRRQAQHARQLQRAGRAVLRSARGASARAAADSASCTRSAEAPNG
jgi:hypothetical protein